MMHIDRTWPKHRHPNTDTESTDDECTLGGYPTFSHGSVSLSHQHWVAQLISGGAFGVHCTQAAEAHHKHCMKLPAQRVRHLDNNNTTRFMQEYLKNTYLFDSMIEDEAKPVVRAVTPVRAGLRTPLTCDMGTDFASPTIQQSFLHSELRIARFELLDLLCNHFKLPNSTASYVLLENFEFRFGQQLCRCDGQIF